MTPEELSYVVNAALSLQERLDLALITSKDYSPEQLALANPTLRRWCEERTRGDWEAFLKSLTQEGCTLQDVQAALHSIPSSESANLPEWACFLRDVIEEARSQRELVDPEQFILGNEIPYCQVLRPFLIQARDRIISRLPDSVPHPHPIVTAKLQRRLLKRLSSICAEALHQEFNTVRSLFQITPTGLLRSFTEACGSSLYNAFVNDLLAGSLTHFFVKYPVLARLASQAALFWVEATVEMFIRLERDRTEIQVLFLENEELGELIDIGDQNSDPHCQGRYVLCLRFSSGIEIVYKPRSIQVEYLFNKLIERTSGWQLPLLQRKLRLLAKDQYGWVELAKQLPCAHLEEVRRYYIRAGMLLCLAYVLSATDLHCENLIASGEFPVLVDLEMLLTARLAPLETVVTGAEAERIAKSHLFDSVLSTGILPLWIVNQDGQAVDISGLGSVENSHGIDSTFAWSDINTDKMTAVYEIKHFGEKSNSVYLRADRVSPLEFINEIILGFSAMYREMIRHRARLLDKDGLWSEFARIEVRHLIRPTRFYAQLLTRSLDTDCLSEGIHRSIVLDRVSREVFCSSWVSPFRNVCKYEREALERLDIPRFEGICSDDTIPLPDGHYLKGCILKSGLEASRTRLLNMDEADLHRQVSFIRASMQIKMDQCVGEGGGQTQLNNDPYVMRAAFLKSATEIGEEILKGALCSSDGSASWVGLTYFQESQRRIIQPLGFDLYNGTTGVAFFLAFLAKATGNRNFEQLALSALQPFRSYLHDHPDGLTAQLGIGAINGIGGVVYAMMRIAQLLNIPDLLLDAENASALITEELIHADSRLDVAGGAAGALLVLIRLYETTGLGKALEHAICCGRHLLEMRERTNVGSCGWTTLNGVMHVGFAHGASGIAYALINLHRVVRDSALVQVAEEALEYERSFYCSERKNWADLRSRGSETTFQVAWCYGAAGVGMVRAGILPILDTNAIRDDLENVLSTIAYAPLNAVDHLCCGNMGRIDVLNSASLILGRTDLLDEAKRIAYLVLDRCNRSGEIHMFCKAMGVGTAPGLFSGMAGVGYTLIRLCFPGIFPSVLLLE